MEEVSARDVIRLLYEQFSAAPDAEARQRILSEAEQYPVLWSEEGERAIAVLIDLHQKASETEKNKGIH